MRRSWLESEFGFVYLVDFETLVEFALVYIGVGS